MNQSTCLETANTSTCSVTHTNPFLNHRRKYTSSKRKIWVPPCAFLSAPRLWCPHGTLRRFPWELSSHLFCKCLPTCLLHPLTTYYWRAVRHPEPSQCSVSSVKRLNVNTMGLNFQTHSKMCCRGAAAESTAREGHLIWATEGELVLPEVESVKWQGRGHHAYEYERETPQRENVSHRRHWQFASAWTGVRLSAWQ